MSTGLSLGTGDLDFSGTAAQAPSYRLQRNQRFARSYDVSEPLADSGLVTVALLAVTGVVAGTGEINLFTLPPGRVKVYTDLSRLVTTQFEATSDLHIGARRHTDPDGTAVTENNNLFGDNIDVGGGAIDAALTVPAAGIHEFNSREGVTIFALIDTADMEAADNLRLHMFFKSAP